MSVPNKTDVDSWWNQYEDECTRLANMRITNSTATELEIEIQYQLTEKLLQKWIEATHLFKGSLN